MNVLLVDHHDSFTFNLAHQLMRQGADVDVVAHDDTELSNISTRLAALDLLVLSPGPGSPVEIPGTLALVHAAMELDVPLLGVCLGMQCIGAALGAEIRCLPQVVHGASTPVLHDGTDIYRRMEQGFVAGRYHSLVLDPATMPADLLVTARTPDGVVMGVRHRTRRVHGMQYHPESILTPAGDRLVGTLLEDVRYAQEAAA